MIYYGLKVDGEIFISHMESLKELTAEIAEYQKKYSHIDFSKGVIFTHNENLRW